MAKKSNKTSYVLDLITKNVGDEDIADEDSVKPSWMPPGEFQETVKKQEPSVHSESYAEREAAKAQMNLENKLKKEYKSVDSVNSENIPNSENQQRLKKMIAGAYDDDPISDTIKSSLEAYIHDEMVEENNKRYNFFSKGDANKMNNDNDRVSPLGNSFEYNHPDTVNAELENTSLADDNNDHNNMDRTSSQNYIFVNVAEEIVRSKVPSIMEESNMCTCDRCTNDVVALALNKIPPRYVVTQKGKLYARINACLPQYQADLLEAIVSACKTVKANTRHTQTPK